MGTIVFFGISILIIMKLFSKSNDKLNSSSSTTTSTNSKSPKKSPRQNFVEPPQDYSVDDFIFEQSLLDEDIADFVEERVTGKKIKHKKGKTIESIVKQRKFKL